MATPTINIQDGFLFQILKSGKPVGIQLITGQRVEGKLKRFDRFALVLEWEDRETLIYKHGIVSVEEPLPGE
ncbi:MAG: RNA chaperone Hfq [Thermoanaerobaculia bacterium]